MKEPAGTNSLVGNNPIAIGPRRRRLRRAILPLAITTVAIGGLCALMATKKSLFPAAVVSTPAVVVLPERTIGNVIYGGCTFPDGPNPSWDTQHDNIYTGFGADHAPTPFSSTRPDVIWDLSRNGMGATTKRWNDMDSITLPYAEPF